MGLVRRLGARLTYANVMSTLAVFVALGGGAYALSVPRNSVGSAQLKRSAVTSAKLRSGAITTGKIQRGAVTSAQIRDRSLTASDFAPGVIPAPAASTASPGPLVLGGARAADTDPLPTPGTMIESVSLTMSSAGKAFVLGTLNSPFLGCGATPCSATWGVYVDGQPVSGTGLHLQAATGSGDGFNYLYTLFGVTPTLQAGGHTVTVDMTSSGSPSSVGQLGAQLGAIAAGA
jgi:hypothetical protein